MCSFQASKLTFSYNLLLLSPAALEVLIYSRGNFLASAWLHDNFILGQNRIFRVNDAKTQPRLNTDNLKLCFSLAAQQWETGKKNSISTEKSHSAIILKYKLLFRVAETIVLYSETTEVTISFEKLTNEPFWFDWKNLMLYWSVKSC